MSVRSLQRAIPRFDVAITVPTRYEDIARRHWNRMTKEAMRETLEFHHKQHIPLHFQPGAAARYSYKARKPGWKAYKQKRWGSGNQDLVASGKSKFRIIRQGRIVIGGAAEGGKKSLEGKLIVRFDWTDKVAAQQREKFEAQNQGFFQRMTARPRERPKAEVTAEDMKREVRKIIPAERTTLARMFRERLMAKVTEFRGQRKRVRMPTT